MKEHGFLFKAEMVLAQLAGTKTQTRRVVARSNSLVDGHVATKAFWSSLDFEQAWVDAGPSPAGNPGPYLKVPCEVHDTVHRVYPRVQVDDRIVCREPTRERVSVQSKALVEYRADGQLRGQLAENNGEGDRIGVTDPVVVQLASGAEPPWRPGIHMFRWAARLVHDVTLVRPERLLAISEKDACAEGIQGHPFVPDDGFPVCTGYMVGKDDGSSVLTPTAAEAYLQLWERINGKGSSLSNPWVFVYGWA